MVCMQSRQSPSCTPLRRPSIMIPPSRRGSSMNTQAPELDPNNVLTAWGSGLGQLGLREDVGHLDPEEYGRARLSHVADTWKGKLDPAEYLNPGRHGEWTSASGSRPAHNPGALVMYVVTCHECTVKSLCTVSNTSKRTWPLQHLCDGWCRLQCTCLCTSNT